MAFAQTLKKLFRCKVAAGQIFRFPGPIYIFFFGLVGVNATLIEVPFSEPLAHKGQILSLKSFSTHQEKTHEWIPLDQ